MLLKIDGKSIFSNLYFMDKDMVHFWVKFSAEINFQGVICFYIKFEWDFIHKVIIYSLILI